MRFYCTIFLFSLLNLFFSNKTIAQTILAEGFEEYYPPDGWAVSYSSNSPNWLPMPPNSGFQYAGQKCIKTSPNQFSPANSWIYSPTLNLTQGITYRLSYWYRSSSLGRIEKLKVTLGNGQNTAAQTTTIRDYPNITNTTYSQGIDLFTVSSTGNYNFALQCYSGPGVGQGLFIDSIRLEYVTSSSCNGNPPTGSVTGLSTVCTGTPFILTLSGLFNTTGLSYQWQSSVIGQNNFTDIAGVTTNIATFTQSTSKDYRCKTTCSNGGQFVYSPTHTVLTPTLCYCTPPPGNCISEAGSYSIDSVSFGTIQNISGCNGNGYTNYTADVPPASITTATVYPITIKTGTNNSNAVVIVGIDYNKNGVFETAERKILTRNNFYHTALISIPVSALAGNTRMRVAVSDGLGGNVFNNCDQPNKGETEDYLLDIVPSTGAGPHFSFYVKATATGANTGVDWANAFTNLSTALSIASAGDTIKVAKGTYTPVTYYSVKDSIILMGGYPNTGSPTNADRDWATNQTILSGANSRPNIIIGNQGLHPETQINGFIMEAGFVTGGSPFASGTGLRLIQSSPTISNCVFRNSRNLAADAGGSAVYSENGSPVFYNCFFLNNEDFQSGTISCTGGGSPTFFNCVFAKNKATSTVHSIQANVKLVNCTFFNNRLEGNSANNHSPSTIYLSSTSNAEIVNSIFYENKVGNTSDTTDIILNNASLLISNSITQVYNSGNPQLISASPKFIDTASITGPDNLFFTPDDGLQLKNPCSPAINNGSNQAISGINTDITGRPRVFETLVDLGAYEAQTTLLPIPQVAYVKAAATGSNNGTSWADAYTSLQAALQSCSDTIKVAAGTYYPSDNNINSALWLENNRVILGGYPNSGNPDNTQRNPATNPTILSGNLPFAGGNKSVIIVKGRSINNTAVLDGFIISDAVGDINGSAALYMIYNAAPIIRNNTIKNNVGGNRSSGATNLFNSHVKYINCLFENNSGTGILSALGAVYNSNSNPVFKSCVFKTNSTWLGSVSSYSGGAIYNNNSNPVIDSCVFFKNKGNNMGGAIANYNSSPSIMNSSFFGNSLESQAGQRKGNDIYNNNSSPVITNCIFSDSTFADRGGSVASENLSNSTFTNCEFNNSKAVYDGAISYSDNSTVAFNRCVFNGSSLSSAANTIANVSNSNCLVVNSIAFNNTANSFIGSSNGTTSIINSTFGHNTLSRVIAHGGTGQLNIFNSIFWDNIKRTGSEILPSASTVLAINNSMLQYYGVNGANGNFVGINPRLMDITNAPGPDGIFKTSDDGFALCSCSPALNTGQNTAITGYTIDIMTNPRIFGSLADIGAYEFQSGTTTAPRAFYVREGAAGTSDGLSWQNAYPDLQSAVLNSCADTIKVAAGTYKPAVLSRDSSFFINHGLAMYGGYPNALVPNENLRDPDIYPTIISGEIGPLADTSDNSKSLFLVNCPDTAVLIDGITFTRSSDEGAVKVIYSKKTVLRNSRLYNNYSLSGPSAYFSQSSNVEVDKCVFWNNGSTTAGRGTLRVQNIWENAIIKNSIFWGNSANMGGAVYSEDSSRFENCLFYGNKSLFGAGIYLHGNPAAKIINCTFTKNSHMGTEHRGTDLFDGSGGTPRVIVRNTVFKDQLSGTLENPFTNSDWYHFTPPPGAPLPLDVQYSVTQTGVPFVINNIHPNNFSFLDPLTPKGADNKWFTVDDGLQPSPCTSAINAGNNSLVINIPTDITGYSRIVNNTVDMGAYESKGAFVTITTADTLVCQGAAVTFTASPVNGGSNPSYQWQVNGVNAGTNSNVFTSSSLTNGAQVKVIMTTSESCINGTSSISNVITIYTTTAPVPAVSIVSSSSTSCANLPITFMATPANGGSNPSYQWQVNGVNTGTNSNVFTSSALTNGAQVRVAMTSSFSCAVPQQANSNLITITINPVVTPAVSISTPTTTICTAATINFTAVPVNGGTDPSYQWQVNGVNAGTNSNVFTSSSLTNGNLIKVILTSNASCALSTTATSNTLIINVTNPATPSITIAGNQVVLSGQSTVLSSIPVDGGSNPQFQWQDSTGVHSWQNITGATSSTINYAPSATGDKVRCILTSNASCVSPTTATSNVLIFTLTFPTAINPVPGTTYGIKFYPNPVTSNLFIDSLRLADKWQTLEIIDLHGKRVVYPVNIMNHVSKQIDIMHLPAGLYIALIRKKNGVTAFYKFVKI